MALHLVPPPSATMSAHHESMADFMDPDPLHVEVFHLPVGTLGLSELAAGATLHDVVPAGCRILTKWPGGSTTLCEMGGPTDYEAVELRNFTSGDFAAKVFARIAAAQALDVVGLEDFELHFLSIPGIYLEALHLVCKGKSGDFVLPLISMDPRLGSDAVCGAAEFLAVARASAEARVAKTSSDPLSS